MAGIKPKDWAIDCVGTAEVETAASAGGARPMNDLGGLVRKKKRKADDGGDGVVVEGDGVAQPAREEEASGAGVNVLVGRKKAKK